MILGSVEEDNSNLRWIRQTVSNPTSDYLTVIEVQVAMLESQCKSMSTRIELRLVQHDNLFGKKGQIIISIHLVICWVFRMHTGAWHQLLWRLKAKIALILMRFFLPDTLKDRMTSE
jgi:hypothetical protein